MTSVIESVVHYQVFAISKPTTDLHVSFTLGNLISLLPTVWFVLFKAFKLFFVIFSCNKNRFLMKKLKSLTTYSIHTKQQNNKTIDEYSFHFCINNLFLYFFLILKIYFFVVWENMPKLSLAFICARKRFK